LARQEKDKQRNEPKSYLTYDVTHKKKQKTHNQIFFIVDLKIRY